MTWTKDNGKFAKDAAEEALTQANRAKEKADYIDVKKPLIDKFTGEQTNLQAQINNLVVEGDSSPESAQARVGTNGARYSTLKARLDDENNEVTAQLAQTGQELAKTEDKLKNVPNATEPLNLLTPYGDNQFTHPKVLYFPNGWNGFKYWMAYTPLPYYDESKENPCIGVSNDMVNWTLPTGLSSGLLDTKQLNDYNSDTHLVYREDLNQLEVWYRGVHETNLTEIIYRRTTTDGVNWTPREIMYSRTGSILNILSPAIIWDNAAKLYRIWTINATQPTYVIQEYTTVTGKSWQLVRSITPYFGAPHRAWHIDVEKTDLGYEAIIATKGGGVKDSLYHCVLPTTVNYVDCSLIMEPNVSGWDNHALYRSCFLKIDNVYYVFYAGVSSNKYYAVGLTIASKTSDIKSLRGITSGYKKELIPGNLYFAKMNEYTGNNIISDFPQNTITTCPIETVIATIENGFPEAMGGHLWTYNFNYSYSFKYQEYETVSGNLYRRRLNSDSTFGRWQKSNLTWVNV